MLKQEIKLDRPIYLGQCILDESKRDMAEFHYDVVKAKYGNKSKLCFTDTDSFAYSIETEDLYKDIGEMSEKFDLSNYPENHSLYDKTNKKQLHKMKDELGGNVMTEFIGLRSKMYSYTSVSGKNDLRAKGIARSAQQKLKHEMYADCIHNEKKTTVEFRAIRASNHVLRTNLVKKTGLSPFDDKRYICDDKVSTIAYGHYSLA
eukprot:Lithocolla_globosa_v1_NODE_6727_length_1044_cov_295.733064.p1 type:complete len:204 gc:universal NODE_6727_length_1044_cov_295.733064:667-56(-)